MSFCNGPLQVQLGDGAKSRTVVKMPVAPRYSRNLYSRGVPSPAASTVHVTGTPRVGGSALSAFKVTTVGLVALLTAIVALDIHASYSAVDPADRTHTCSPYVPA